MSRRQVCVDAIVPPSGRVMHSGFCVGYLLIVDAFGRSKCPAIPEARIPWSAGVWISLFVILIQMSNVQLKFTNVLSFHHHQYYHHL